MKKTDTKNKESKNYTVAEIRDMILKDSPEIEYGRYNITAPKIVMEMLEKETDTPRSTLITSYILEELEESYKKDTLRKWAHEARSFNENSDLTIVESFPDDIDE